MAGGKGATATAPPQPPVSFKSRLGNRNADTAQIYSHLSLLPRPTCHHPRYSAASISTPPAEEK